MSQRSGRQKGWQTKPAALACSPIARTYNNPASTALGSITACRPFHGLGLLCWLDIPALKCWAICERPLRGLMTAISVLFSETERLQDHRQLALRSHVVDAFQFGRQRSRQHQERDAVLAAVGRRQNDCAT